MLRARFVCLMLFLGTLLVYLPVRQFEFLNFDDPLYVRDNPIVQEGLTWHGLQWAFSGAHASNWHPVTWLSHMLDCELFGADPGAPHLINAMIHAANAALVFLLLTQLTGSFWPAAFAAALFAWHPLRVESVAWIAERKDVLSTFFGLLALLAYLRYGRERRPKDFWLTVGLYALGIMAKPMLVTLPFIFLLIDYWPLKRWTASNPKPSGPLRLLLEKWPFFLLSAIASVLTVQAQQAEAIVPLDLLPMNVRVSNALTACAAYLGKMLWPVNLATPYSATIHINWPATWLAAGVLAAISWAVWRTRRTRPWWLVGWLWFLGTLVPVIGLVQVGSQSMADRYTYVPMIGVLIGLTGTLQELATRKRLEARASTTVASIILGGCLFATSRQLPYWHDSVTLFTHALTVTRDNAVANINLGAALDLKGEKEKAAACYREALRIAPNTGIAHNNLAGVLADLGQYDKAEEEYRKALELKPSAGLTYCNLGMMLAKIGRFDDAMAEYDTAARLRPWDPFPMYLLAKAQMRQGQSAEAIANFHRSLRRYQDYVKSQVYLARLLATSEDPQIRNPAEAIAMAERANVLTGGQQAFMLDTLAAAYADGGRFADAEQVLQQAIAASTKAEEPDTVAEMQKRLKLYQSHQPYRESPINTQVETGHSQEIGR